jgi:hypothetical protein
LAPFEQHNYPKRRYIYNSLKVLKYQNATILVFADGVPQTSYNCWEDAILKIKSMTLEKKHF